jgi:hypothetical protein
MAKRTRNFGDVWLCLQLIERLVHAASLEERCGKDDWENVRLHFRVLFTKLSGNDPNQPTLHSRLGRCITFLVSSNLEAVHVKRSADFVMSGTGWSHVPTRILFYSGQRRPRAIRASARRPTEQRGPGYLHSHVP